MEPDSIAFVQCAGSRDKSMGIPYCSRICCMYAIKQAMLLSGALPLADITIYYMDIRAFGKGYEQFFQNAQAMGIQFVKAKVALIEPGENGAVTVRYEDQLNGGTDHGIPRSGGSLPGQGAGLEPRGAVRADRGPRWLHQRSRTEAGAHAYGGRGPLRRRAAVGVKDIVDSIAEASAAAMHAANYLQSRKKALEAVA